MKALFSFLLCFALMLASNVGYPRDVGSRDSPKISTEISVNTVITAAVTTMAFDYFILNNVQKSANPKGFGITMPILLASNRIVFPLIVQDMNNCVYNFTYKINYDPSKLGVLRYTIANSKINMCGA